MGWGGGVAEVVGGGGSFASRGIALKISIQQKVGPPHRHRKSGCVYGGQGWGIGGSQGQGNP